MVVYQTYPTNVVPTRVSNLMVPFDVHGPEANMQGNGIITQISLSTVYDIQLLISVVCPAVQVFRPIEKGELA